MNSITLSAIRSPGACTVKLDNIVACLSASDSRSLSLQSLIGKNNNHPNDHWWCVRSLSAGPLSSTSLSGTTVGLDMEVTSSNLGGVQFKAYPYVSETVTTYKCETIKTGQSLNGGSQSNPGNSYITWTSSYFPTTAIDDNLKIVGGYDRTNMSTVTHKTFYDGLDYNGQCIGTYNGGRMNFYNFGTVRYYLGMNIGAAGSYIKFFNCESHCNSNAGFSVTTSTNVLSNIKLYGNNTNLSVGGGGTPTNNKFYNITCDNSLGYHIQPFGDIHNYYENITLLNGQSFSMFLRDSINTVYNGLTAANNTSGFIYFTNNLDTVFYNLSVGGSSLVQGNFGDVVSSIYGNFSYQGYNGVENDVRTYTSNGALILSEYGALRRTPVGYAWKMTYYAGGILPTDTKYPYIFKVATVAVRANTPTRVMAYIRTNTTNNTGGLMCFEDVFYNVSETRSYATLINDTYVPVTLTITSSKDAVVPVYFFGTLASGVDYLLIDDISIL